MPRTADLDPPARVRATSIGPTVLKVLAGSIVQPFAIFERCLYATSLTGCIACIGDESIGDGPLNALLIRGDKGWPAIATAEHRNIEVDVDNAQRWQPRIGDDGDTTSLGWAQMAELRAAVRAFRLDGGLSPFLTPLLEDAVPTAPTPLLANARPGISSLREWLRLGDNKPSPMPAEVSSLIGLGPGLTPSGDDLLGGCLMALRRTGRRELAARLSEPVLSAARTATSRISLAHLECAAAGYGNAALHNVLESLLAGATGELADCLNALDRIGHSSGWDGLVGVVLAINPVQ